MSATKFLNNVDGDEHQLVNWILHSVDTDFMSSDLISGRIWYNVIDNVIKYYDGVETLTVASVQYIDSLTDNTGVDTSQPYKLLARQGDEWYGVDPSDVGQQMINLDTYSELTAIFSTDENPTYLVEDATGSPSVHSTDTWGIYKLIDGNPSLIALGEPNIEIDNNDRSITIRFFDSKFKIWVESHHGDTSHSIAIEKI